MKILSGLIRRELRLQAEKDGYCAVYEDELQRVWPLNEENRKAKIRQFAKENGFRLVYYKPGLCAIFEEALPEPSRAAEESLTAPTVAPHQIHTHAGRHAESSPGIV